TKYGIDSEIASRLPRRSTVWLTWSEIGELLRHGGRLPAVDRFLWKEFAKMLKHIGIPMLPSISPAALRRLRLLNRFVGGYASNYEYGVVSASVMEILTLAIDRMEIHRDSEWSALLKSGWRPYARVWAVRDKYDNPSVLADVGYIKWYAKGSVYERSLTLRLECGEKPRVVTLAGWGLRVDGSLDWENRPLERFTPSQSARLFSLPIHKAIRQAKPTMRKTLSRFKRSKYYKCKD
ncbi:MAG: hypothetical protein ABIJ00_04010, partial [Candidatus Eisenbacteria bacterium]